jgi:hypothetical protein
MNTNRIKTKNKKQTFRNYSALKKLSISRLVNSSDRIIDYDINIILQR